MSISTFRVLRFAVVAAALSTGMMQGAVATFHLSVPAHWGTTLLMPGDYRLSLPIPSAGEQSLRIEGSGKTIMEVPVAVEQQSNSRSSHLQLAEVGGSYFVREYDSGAAGERFLFPVPKAAKR